MARKRKTQAAGATQVAVVRLAEAAGVAFTERDGVAHGACPFHEDAGASLVIRPDTNTWECPVCDARGSAVEWVMRAEGVSRRHALALLSEGLPSQTRPGRVKYGTVRKLAPPVSPDADDGALLGQVIAYYHETLRASPDALAYLESRGIRSQEAIERFKLGYANRTLGYRLPMNNRKLGAELRGRLAALYGVPLAEVDTPRVDKRGADRVEGCS